MFVIKPLVKGIGSGIGLAGEAVAAHKEKKQHAKDGASPGPSSETTQNQPSGQRARSTSPYPLEKGDVKDEDDADDSAEDDEEDWALDDAAADLDVPPPSYEASTAGEPEPQQVEDVVRSFNEKHKLGMQVRTHQPLPMAVILPQRRPKDKSRGFVRAYAPVLGEYSGIDPQTFIDFLNNFDQASKASPVFTVINAAAQIVGFVPNPITLAVSIAVQVAAGTAKEVQSRYRANTFLDQINKSLFKPRGLYCLIMSFRPDQPNQRSSNININDATSLALSKSFSPPISSTKSTTRQFRVSSGRTTGELSLPSSAPLIYPALDRAADAASTNSLTLTPSKQSSLATNKAFIADYLDRRAHAKYLALNPDSSLSAAAPPGKKFANRYADPDHPANSGSVFALLTGGYIDPPGNKRQRRAKRRAAREGRTITDEELHDARMGYQRQRTGGGISGIRRVLRKDALYLTVVNMPSEAELREIRLALEREEEEKKGQM